MYIHKLFSCMYAHVMYWCILKFNVVIVLALCWLRCNCIS